MQQDCTVLWVSGEGTTDLSLRKVLADAGMKVRLAQSCGEVQKILANKVTPDVLFCDALLPDGTWADILSLTNRGSTYIPVIVVSQVVDVNLYVNALEMGAADFIVPPFYFRDISHVLKCSMGKVVAVQKPGTA